MEWIPFLLERKRFLFKRNDNITGIYYLYNGIHSTFDLIINIKYYNMGVVFVCNYRFPSDSKTVVCTTPTAEPKTVAVASSKSTGSPKRSKATPNDRDGCPPTAAVLPAGSAESPLRGRRRASLMGFRRETIKHRGGSVSRADGGEDADSDTSTICRRKLSITGREGTEKVPWCGCWGNGCL